MAVTFKVPKSPSRDIAITDTFLGVDLTNTGANIDGYRSPNAPNMIRNVPGKVRKRMGYYKEILFGTRTNVNFADGTSCEEQEICIVASNLNQWIKLYDVIKGVGESDDEVYAGIANFDYKSENGFEICAGEEGSYSGSFNASSSEEWRHVGGVIPNVTGNPKALFIRSSERQKIYIKNFALLRVSNSSYKWSPAPKYFVKRETNDPVYGCHFLKNGTDGYDGDRIANVNRALETSDEWKEMTFQSGSYTGKIYDLAELPCKTQAIYADFDYEYEVTSGAPEVYIRFFGDNRLDYQLENTSGHKRLSFSPEVGTPPTNGCLPQVSYRIGNTGAAPQGTLKIKNFMLTYELVDTTYEWSPAPEDNKKKFHLHDMYNIDPKDYATTESFSKETASFSTTKTETFTVCGADSRPEGVYQYIAFDITTSLTNSSAELDSVQVCVLDYGSNVRLLQLDSDKNFRKKHVELFTHIRDFHFISELEVTIAVSSASTKAKINITNVVVKQFTIRDSFVVSSKWFLYHVGKEFYLRAHDSATFTSVFQEANEHISSSWQIGDNSYILDGKDFYEFSIKDGERVQVVDQDNAYIPLVTFAKEYNGGGTAKEALNLLQPGFIEQFLGVAGERTYQLSFGDLDDTPVKAWLLDADANWILKEEDIDFSVDRETGKVTFVTAPGESPITGEDSVKIQAYRTVEGYRDRVTNCSFGALYGVGGAADRIFIAGNPEHPNWDFYSQFQDATYFPDTGYTTLGSSQSAITGYAIVANYLATFKDGFDQSQSVFIREGDMLVTDEETGTSEPVFKLINSLQGVGSISPYSFGYLQTEPVCLTKAGIYAITEQDITGEKYSQNRSFYLDGKLRKETGLETAVATVYDDQYILALNGSLYVLDGLQATRTDKSEPYATRQYAGFYCTDIPAKVIWNDDAVCFGTNDGKVCRFYTDQDTLESYNDDGKPIYCCWETPDLDGKLFYKNKTFRYIAIRLMQAVKTSLKIYSRRFGLWTFIKEQTAISNIFDFENLDFNLFSFSADLSERLIHSKTRVKKVDKARFRIENDKLNEPFGLFDLAFEYVESGNYKG